MRFFSLVLSCFVLMGCQAQQMPQLDDDEIIRSGPYLMPLEELRAEMFKRDDRENHSENKERNLLAELLAQNPVDVARDSAMLGDYKLMTPSATPFEARGKRLSLRQPIGMRCTQSVSRRYYLNGCIPLPSVLVDLYAQYNAALIRFAPRQVQDVCKVNPLYAEQMRQYEQWRQAGWQRYQELDAKGLVPERYRR